MKTLLRSNAIGPVTCKLENQKRGIWLMKSTLRDEIDQLMGAESSSSNRSNKNKKSQKGDTSRSRIDIADIKKEYRIKFGKEFPLYQEMEEPRMKSMKSILQELVDTGDYYRFETKKGGTWLVKVR